MTLLYPWILLLWLVVPLLVWLRYGWRSRPALLTSSALDLNQLPASWRVRLQPLLPLLYALSLVALVGAMARPQKGLEESRVRTEAVDMVLLVDVSTSMRAEDLAKGVNRLEAAKEAVRQFVKARPDDRIGLVAFSAMPYSVAPLTLDHDWLISHVERLRTGMLEDGTAIGTAIAAAVNRLRGSEAKSKLVILLTDGVNNAGKISPVNASEAARALGIKIYTIGAGSNGLADFPIQTPFGTQVMRQRVEIDEDTLTKVAATTGGRYFRATDFAGLKKIYGEIDLLEKTEINVDQYKRFEERFQALALSALLLLLLERALSTTWLRRLPS